MQYYGARSALLILFNMALIAGGSELLMKAGFYLWPHLCWPPRIGVSLVCVAILIQARQTVRPDEGTSVAFGVYSVRGFLAMFSGSAAFYGTLLTGFYDVLGFSYCPV